MRMVVQLSSGDKKTLQSTLRQLESRKDLTPDELKQRELLTSALNTGSDLAPLYLMLPSTILETIRPGSSVFLDTNTAETQWRIPGEIDESLTTKLTSSPSQWPDRPSAGYNASLNFIITNNELKVIGHCIGYWPSDDSETDRSWAQGSEPCGVITLADADVEPNYQRTKLPNDLDDSIIRKEISFTAKELTDEANLFGQTETDTLIYANRSDILSLLHRKLGLQSISDHYSVWLAFPTNAPQTVKYLMDHLAEMKSKPEWNTSTNNPLIRKKSVSCPIWGWDAKCLYMRERSPYQLDSIEVPNCLLKQFRNSLLQRHCLNLDDASDMASFIQDRPSANNIDWPLLLRSRGDDWYHKLMTFDYKNRSAFCLYGSLTTIQRRHVLTSGIRIADMSPFQLACLADLLSARITSVWNERQVGLYTNGIRVDKPQHGDDTPILIRVDRRKSQGFILYSPQSMRGEEITASSTEEALKQSEIQYPELVKGPYFLGQDSGYTLVLLFENGAVKEFPLTVYEPVTGSANPL